MRSVKPARSGELTAVAEEEAIAGAPEPDDPYDTDTYEMFRVSCPDCGQPIALLADEETLPEHALCATRWDPFGLTVCPGSGRPAGDAEDADGLEAEEGDVMALLTLPEGLDWRTQPFSHVGGPGTRAHRVAAPHAPGQGRGTATA